MNKGFSFIEIIATLLITGLLGAAIFVSLLPAVEGLSLARDQAAQAQKSRMAMARLTREMTTITSMTTNQTHAVRYHFLIPEGPNAYLTQEHHLQWSGNPGDPLTLQGATLLDDVQDFQLVYPAGPPQAIGLAFETGDGLVVSNLIVPRNMIAGGAP